MKAMFGARRAQGVADASVFQFRDLAAVTADQKLGRMEVRAAMRMFKGVRTGHERGQSFDAMDQPLFKQKVQRPIDRGRCRATVVFTQAIEQFISPRWPAPIQHQPQHQPTNIGQARSTLGTD